jgi:hypothetical protein
LCFRINASAFDATLLYLYCFALIFADKRPLQLFLQLFFGHIGNFFSRGKRKHDDPHFLDIAERSRPLRGDCAAHPAVLTPVYAKLIAGDLLAGDRFDVFLAGDRFDVFLAGDRLVDRFDVFLATCFGTFLADRFDFLATC